MQQPTINQLNGRLAANQTIEFYHSLNWYDKDAVNRENWRNRYFKFDRYGESVSMSVSGNFIYGAAETYFKRIAGISGYDYHRDHRQVFFEIEGITGNKLQFQVRAEQDMNGVRLVVETNFKPLKGADYYAYFKIRSHSTFAGLDVKEYFMRRVLRKYLFEPGLFRDIQIWKNCSKVEAMQVYKEIIKPKPFEVDTWKAWRRLFKRRLNIQISDDIPETLLPSLYHSYQFQKSRKKLFKQPSVFEMHEEYSSQYDDEENMEGFVNEYFEGNYPKNAIFI